MLNFFAWDRPRPLVREREKKNTDPQHDRHLRGHVGTHAQIMLSVLAAILQTNFMEDMAASVRNLFGQAVVARQREITLAFYCRSGQHRSVAVSELMKLILGQITGLEIVHAHINSPEWRLGGSCGRCATCRTPLLQADQLRAIYRGPQRTQQETLREPHPKKDKLRSK